MDLASFMTYCMSKTAVEETFPFDQDTLVYKVAGKMFALCGLERTPLFINLKCDPEYALELREKYEGVVTPGFHMSKKHWNSVVLEAELEMQMYYGLIDHSYDLVRKSLPKKVREDLDKLEQNA